MLESASVGNAPPVGPAAVRNDAPVAHVLHPFRWLGPTPPNNLRPQQEGQESQRMGNIASLCSPYTGPHLSPQSKEKQGNRPHKPLLL